VEIGLQNDQTAQSRCSNFMPIAVRFLRQFGLTMRNYVLLWLWPEKN